MVKFKPEDLQAFMPNEKAIRRMHQKYPVYGTFIMDMMLSDSNAAGWFVAGYLFGMDKELQEMGFDKIFALLGANGIQRNYYDA